MDLLVEVDEAKTHLRVLHDSEDDAIQTYILAAQEQAQEFLGRNVYLDQDALDQAIAEAPDVLSAASAAYDLALTTTYAMTVEAERVLYEQEARDVYREASDVWQRTRRGIVMNESIRTAILLITASLWEHRGDEDGVQGIPPAARSFLWPYRVGLGV